MFVMHTVAIFVIHLPSLLYSCHIGHQGQHEYERGNMNVLYMRVFMHSFATALARAHAYLSVT